MLYYRSRRGGTAITRGAARVISLAALALYPAGALIADLGSSPLVRAGGFVLVTASFFCVLALMGSSLQRIVGEEVGRLDEYEVKLRSRAVGAAYSCLTALILIAILYCALAVDHGAWVPRTYGEFSGLFWGAFLYASVLPSAFLAWQIDANEAAADEDVL